jgi:uncharacterized membrane protein
MSDSESSTGTEAEEWEAAAALLLVIGLQVLVATLSAERGWKLWTLPWWIWLILIGPEIALLVFLRMGDDPHDALLLALVMGAVNVLALTMLIGSVASSHEHSGGQLLLKGLTVWATNVTAFGLAFWELEYRRDREFLFPQQDEDKAWQPSFFDYFYVSFTNSIAFSPTDTMPLSKRAKLLMLLESSVSVVAIPLAAARAVKIFK